MKVYLKLYFDSVAYFYNYMHLDNIDLAIYLPRTKSL